MAARSIARKLADIADAAWEQGDGASKEDDNYGEYGATAERRIERFRNQVETLAADVVKHRFAMTDEHMVALFASAEKDEILAEALVGAWDKVEALTDALKARVKAARDAYYGSDDWDEDGAYRLAPAPVRVPRHCCGTAITEPHVKGCFNYTAPADPRSTQLLADELGSPIALTDPITGHTIKAAPRDPNSPFNFECCGGLRPAHSSRCRKF